MNIFFDMDNTLLGLDQTLRPGALSTLQQLHADGHRIFVWSGARFKAEDLRVEVDGLGLRNLVEACFLKPLFQYANAVEAAGFPVLPDLVVDDIPDVPRTLGGISVAPYRFLVHSQGDREMERVYLIVQEYCINGFSADAGFYMPPRRGAPKPGTSDARP